MALKWVTELWSERIQTRPQHCLGNHYISLECDIEFADHMLIPAKQNCLCLYVARVLRFILPVTTRVHVWSVCF